jgi:hypothetical protein
MFAPDTAVQRQQLLPVTGSPLSWGLQSVSPPQVHDALRDVEHLPPPKAGVGAGNGRENVAHGWSCAIGVVSRIRPSVVKDSLLRDSITSIEIAGQVELKSNSTIATFLA